MAKMKIEIWSDIMCPFCYIGKRRFEKSLADSAFKDELDIEWKSYQLNPDLVTDTSIRIDDYLAIHKEMSIIQARQLNQQVTEMAKKEGLVYDFDKSILANSLKAHQLLHFAKSYHKQDEAKELLFKAYFTEGKNIDDISVLGNILNSLQLDADLFEQELASGELLDEVKMDVHEARQIGVKGVPFFVYDRKYAISGAQPLELFEQTLSKVYEEWNKENNSIIIETAEEGQSCGPEGCE